MSLMAGTFISGYLSVQEQAQGYFAISFYLTVIANATKGTKQQDEETEAAGSLEVKTFALQFN